MHDLAALVVDRYFVGSDKAYVQVVMCWFVLCRGLTVGPLPRMSFRIPTRIYSVKFNSEMGYAMGGGGGVSMNSEKKRKKKEICSCN
jgi:hypothetical protein